MDFWQIVHEDDRWMVKQKDIDFLAKLSVEQIEALQTQDDTFRLATFLNHLDAGMSKLDAGKRVRMAFPVYYLDPEQRDFEDMEFPDDARLSFPLKKRLGPLKLMKVKKKLSGAHTSFNACVRDLIRQGVLK